MSKQPKLKAGDLYRREDGHTLRIESSEKGIRQITCSLGDGSLMILKPYTVRALIDYFGMTLVPRTEHE